jgi:four helix bundle protein
MTRTHFETLRVYQLSETLADTIWRIVEKWRPFARDTVGKQIVRAADSIGANIAEGTGKGMLPDHRRYVRVARGSLYETKHWLRRAYTRKLLTAAQVESLKTTLDELTRVLNGYLRSLNNRVNAKPNFNGRNADLKPKT